MPRRKPRPDRGGAVIMTGPVPLPPGLAQTAHAAFDALLAALRAALRDGGLDEGFSPGHAAMLRSLLDGHEDVAASLFQSGFLLGLQTGHAMVHDHGPEPFAPGGKIGRA